jgi:RNA polymerase sigma factor (sigma-70 family)
METNFTKAGLSAREQEVIQLIFAGRSYSAIAQQLNISIETVRKHAHNIYTKVQVRGKNAAREVLV